MIHHRRHGYCLQIEMLEGIRNYVRERLLLILPLLEALCEPLSSQVVTDSKHRTKNQLQCVPAHKDIINSPIRQQAYHIFTLNAAKFRPSFLTLEVV